MNLWNLRYSIFVPDALSPSRHMAGVRLELMFDSSVVLLQRKEKKKNAATRNPSHINLRRHANAIKCKYVRRGKHAASMLMHFITFIIFTVALEENVNT